MGEIHGPFTPQELRRKAAAGEITPDAWVRKTQDGNWVTAERVSGLFGEPTSAASPQEPVAPDFS